MISLGQPLTVHVQDDIGRHTHLVIQIVGGSQQHRHTPLIEEMDLVPIPQSDYGHAIQQLLCLHLVNNGKEHIIDGRFLRLGIGIRSGIFSGRIGGFRRLGSGGGKRIVRCQAQIGSRRQLGIRLHPSIQEDQALRSGCLRTKHLETVAEHQPTAGGLQGKAFDGGLHLDDHRAGHLDIHLHHIQIGQLRLQLFRFFPGGKAKQIIPCLHSQQINNLLFGIDAGIGRGGAVGILDAEIGNLEQQVDGQYHARRQHTQKAQDSHNLAPAADTHFLHLRHPARRSGRPLAVTR